MLLWTISPYREIHGFFANIYFKIKAFCLSKYFWIVIFLEIWFDGPEKMRVFIKNSVKRALKQPFILLVYADRSKSLTLRFIEKRKKKLYVVWLALCECYIQELLIWRKIVKYWRAEPWRYVCGMLTMYIYIYFRFSHLFIYYPLLSLKQAAKGDLFVAHNPKFLGERYWWRLQKHRIKVHGNYEVPRCNPTGYQFIVQYGVSDGHKDRFSDYHSKFFTSFPKTFIFEHKRKIYFLITVYYCGLMWFFNMRIYKQALMLSYAAFDDFIIVADEDGEIGIDDIIRYKLRCLGVWFHLIYLPIRVDDFFSWCKYSKGRIYTWNNEFIKSHNNRKWYWLRHEYIIPSYLHLGNDFPALYIEEPTPEDIKNYNEKTELDKKEWTKKRNKRRIKNNWPVKNFLRIWHGPDYKEN